MSTEYKHRTFLTGTYKATVVNVKCVHVPKEMEQAHLIQVELLPSSRLDEESGEWHDLENDRTTIVKIKDFGRHLACLILGAKGIREFESFLCTDEEFVVKLNNRGSFNTVFIPDPREYED